MHLLSNSNKIRYLSDNFHDGCSDDQGENLEQWRRRYKRNVYVPSSSYKKNVFLTSRNHGSLLMAFIVLSMATMNFIIGKQLTDIHITNMNTQAFNEQRRLRKSFVLGASFFSRRNDDIEVSVVILTYRKYEALANLLSSVTKQRQSNFEIILVDNGCLEETKAVVDKFLSTPETSVPYKYIPLCDNPGYAAGNNAGFKKASPTSKQILFLNDDVVLSKPDFIENMVKIAQTQERSGAVGCKLLNADGTEIIEAGSIVWANAGATGIGRGRKDINAPEFSYPKPVDYISGACLMVNRAVFEDYGGFDGKNFPNYYEDTDLQFHIQHGVGREVWLQPKSVALHDEHGSFGTEESKKLMDSGSKIFAKKWGAALKQHHLNAPFHLEGINQDLEFFKASDLRARNPKKANILYFDDKSPNKSRGSGYGRSFDNLSMLADLGHRVTLVTWLPLDSENWCDDNCVDKITGLGVEYVTTRKWNELVQSRIGYYDIVIVSRPSTFKATYKKWQYFYRQKSFSLIYDCEALWFRRDEVLNEIVQSKNIQFPGYKHAANQEHMALKRQTDRRSELSMIQMANTVITVSEGERKQLIKLLSPDNTNVKVIGHVMDVEQMTKTSFSKRNGILFIGSFNKIMYYNGDAIWYFLEYIYPMVIELSASNAVPPLTIAGRDIPRELRQFTLTNKVIAKHVTFVESPPTIKHLFETNRIFIAPHLYGSGIQYKVSEALAFGLPLVMSTFTKESFGEIPGCIGSDNKSFAKCVIDVHGDEKQWELLSSEGISFIERTHSRKESMKQWSDIIDSNVQDVSKRHSNKLVNIKMRYPTEKCAEGEDVYLAEYTDVASAVKAGHFQSGFQHWRRHGKHEGRNYYCDIALH